MRQHLGDGMDPGRRLPIENPSHSTLECKPSDRDKFPASASEGETGLRNELQASLPNTRRAPTFLDKPTVPAPSNVPVENHERHARLEPDWRAAHSRPPWWMFFILGPFLAHAVFITAFAVFGPEPMGVDVKATEGQPVVSRVVRASPGERAGIERGDVLVRANERPIPGGYYWYWFLGKVEVGQPIVVETDRRAQRVRTVLVLKPRPTRYWSSAQGVVITLELCGQFLALAVACFLAFLGRQLLACLGALFLAVYSMYVFMPLDGFASMWRQWPVWYQGLLWICYVVASLGFAIWFTFFALFPRPSFQSRWIWVLVWTPMLVASLLFNYQTWHFIYSPENMVPSKWMSFLAAACWIGYLPSSFVMLAIKYRRLEGETEKRRIRLVVVSLAFVIALGGVVLVYSQPDYSQSPGAALFSSLPILTLAVLAGVAFPLCFAYAILRHRLFDIRVIIRQGIRYAAAKQLLLLAAPAIVAVFFADLYAHKEQRVDTIVQDRGWIYLTLAGLAALAHIRRQHWLQSLDRHFFREQYNAQEIVQATLEQVRAAGSLAEVAPTVVKQIGAAMHPTYCAVLEYHSRNRGYELVDIYPEGMSPPALSTASRAVQVAKAVAKPVQLASEGSWLARQLPSSEAQSLEDAGVDLIAPVKGRGSDALIVMGRKRSEEPYTSEDIRLLENVSIGLALLPSRRFPETRFRLESQIGHGGMGVVYEAVDLQLERKVAMKLISENLVADPAALERFQREGHILASFQHPNVVALFDVGIMPDGRPFLVMERLQGRTLREELDCRTKLSSDEARSIVRQLCAGLSAAHRRSLIHRDLKPENIFLCDEGAQRLVKILDFGLAKLFLEDSTSAGPGTFSTVTGLIAGTPAYMSPELLSGAKADWRCDVWALAVITHEMLTGQHPVFTRDSGLVEISLTGLPQCWRDFFNRSLADEPSQRPESVDVFLERFERCSGGV
ncbi:MAG: protein kinase [Acidobacteriaceae bacterium]|nr:protein kinase [Acidobacteriaceae bacterium]